MKKIFIAIIAAFAAFTSSYAQEMDQAAMMKAWEEYMKVTDVHKMLAKSDGTWKTETTMWMDPKGPPMKEAGTCVNRMILGGRYQESIIKGKMMGKPFEGRGLLAFDNAKKMLINTWVDNMGTGITVLSGKWDESTKSVTFNGTMVDPSTGADTPVKEVYTMVNESHHTLEMYMNYAGQEVKSFEIKFTRVGK